MIFNLDLIQTQDAERVIFNIVSRYPRSYGGIITIVDTGSPRTIISVKDAFFLKIPLANLESSKPISGFGRGSVPCKRLNNFKFYVKSSDGKIKNIEMPVNVVDISELKKMNTEMQENAYRVPSVIGLDFLKSQKLKLVIDFKNDASYFEELEVEGIQ